MTAQVIDSVLYQATDSANFTATGVEALQITDPDPNESVGGNVTVNWKGGVGPYKLSIPEAIPAYNNTGISGTNQNVNLGPGLSGKSYTATVTDASGKTASVTFKR
jgi:hypothetical protein